MSASYTIQKVGTYPTEQYNIVPVDYNNTIFDYGSINAENLFRFYNNHRNDINILSDKNNQIDFNYDKSVYYVDNVTNYRNLALNGSDNTNTFIWKVSGLRNANIGPIFNYFYINFSQINNDTTAKLSSLNLDYRSYILYPQRLFLKPLSVIANGDGTFTLQTSSVLSNYSYSFFNSPSAEVDASKYHILNKQNSPSFLSLSGNTSNINLIYGISASKNVVIPHVLDFTPTYNPITFTKYLETPNISNIRPDSTFIKYNTLLSYNSKISHIGEQYTEETPTLNLGFRSSFIENINLNNKNTQTFQLVQSNIFINQKGDDIKNSILNANINLNSSFFSYVVSPTGGYYFDSNFRPVNSLTGIKYTPIQFRYIVDSSVFFNSNTAANYNVTTNIPLNSSIAYGYNSFDNVNWNLLYPVWYYTFKSSISNTNFTNPSDTFNLNFNVSPSVVNQTTSSASISCYLVSNNNLLKLDLPTYAPYDYISLNLVDTILDDDVYISTQTDGFILNTYPKSTVGLLSCFYGSNYDIYYDLYNSPYIPTNQLSSNGFKIISSPNYGEFDIILRPSLSSNFFNFKTDSSDVVILKFFKDQLPQNKLGYPIFFKVLSEYQDLINLDCSSLNTSDTFPQRDLRGTNISWDFTKNTPVSSNIKIYSLDSNNVPYFISPNTAYTFNNKTWNVYVSGYGPYTTTILLSSQKYNEIATIDTDPRLFDYLSTGKFVIGLSGNNNSNPDSAYQFVNTGNTVNFTLTAGIKIGNIIYNIPDFIPLYWSWDYFSKTQPLTAFYLKTGNVYLPSTNDISLNVSALNFSITLTSVYDSFENFDIKFNLTSHYKANTLLGSYTANIENYPDFSIFNTDFKTTYQNYPLTAIANTRLGKNVITRPNSDYKSFTFYPNTDILPKLKASAFKWIITSDGIVSYTNTITSTNPSTITSPVSVNWTIPNGVRTTVVTLCAQKAYLNGWTFKHDILASTTINTISSKEFYTAPKFITFPRFSWLQNHNGYVTLIDQSNYTLSIAPTSYQNTKNGNQYFYLSANRSGIEFDYMYGKNNTFLPTFSSVSLVSFNENTNATDLKYQQGLPISLTAYSNLYPKYPNIKDLSFVGITSSNQIYSDYYRLTTQTIPFSGNNSLSFYQNPKTIPYDNFILKNVTVDKKIVFDPKTITQTILTTTPITEINLDNNLTVSVLQTITPPNTSNSPVRLLDNLSTKTVHYMVSSRHWIEYIDVPASNGIYQLFTLYVGDATQPFTVDAYVRNPLVLSANASFDVYIPPTTFDLYPLSAYSGNRNIWNTINTTTSSTPTTIYAYTTSVKPEIYISSYYALTGENISIEFQTPQLAKIIDGLPDLITNMAITSYNVYFGDGNSQYHTNLDDVIYYSYSSGGVYLLSYDVNYNNGKSANFQLSQSPITIYENWPTYDQSKIRLLTETALTLPWNIDEIYIQPNEFGDADIFNTAIDRLYDCLDYLKSNTQTINTDAPTLFYGWLGYNSADLSKPLQWHTVNYNSLYYTKVQNATAVSNIDSKYYFSNLIDVKETENYIFTIDGTKLRVFYNGKIPKEINFDNIDQINQLIQNPVSIDFDEINNNLYVVDNIKNKIFKLNLSFGYISEINIQLSVGNYGAKEDPNKFFAPSQIIYFENNVFILDYNNLCIKQYTQDLNWIRTYYTDDFIISKHFKPITFDIHPITLFPYVLTQNYYIYVFDHLGNVISNFLLKEAFELEETINKIFFDENGDFLYVLTSQTIFKYTILGDYISELSIPNYQSINYVSGRSSNKRSLIITTKTSILKVQDIVTKFAIGQGLPYNFWTRDQMHVKREEFAQDINYNRSFTRLIQNIKSFRDIFDSMFIVAEKKENFGTVRFFTKTPIAIDTRPVFSNDIENETVMVGVNEFNIPQVLNREIKKIYDALLVLNKKLTITSNLILTGINTGCLDPFCWSWNSMSCYGLTLPVIRICNINPITYAELESNTQNGYNYAQSIDWGSAWGSCCDKTTSPLG